MVDAIKLNQVDIIFRQRPLLTDVNMLISTGDLALLNGANGSGKSTLLKVISAIKKKSKLPLLLTISISLILLNL